MAERSHIAQILKDLTAVYSTQNYNAEPERPDLYYLTLEEYDTDVLQAMFEDAVRFCKWYPKPAELREIAERKQNAKDKGEEPARIFWAATSMFGAWLRHEITDAQFDSDRAVLWMRKQHGDRSWWRSENGTPDPEPVLKHHFAPDDIIEYDADGYPIEFEFAEAVIV